MARPRIPIEEETLEQIKELAAIRCTQEEAARVLGVSLATFENWLKSRRIRDLWEQGFALGKMSLRRAQFEAAQSGNPAMLIWLGKLWLDQVDPTEAKRRDEEDQRPVKVFIYPAETASKEAWLSTYSHLGAQAAPPLEIEHQRVGEAADSDTE